MARGERRAPRHLRGGRRADAGTIVRTGRGDRPRHVHHPADGAARRRSGRPSTTHARPTNSTRPSRSTTTPAGSTIPLRHPAPTEVPERLIGRRCAAGSSCCASTAVGSRSTASPAANAGAPSPPTPRCPCGSCAIRARPRPWLVAVHGQGMGRPSDDRMLRVRAAPRGARRQRRAAGASAARAAGGRVRPRPAVRLQRLPRQQRARADAVGLGPAPAAALAPRRPGSDRRRRARALARVLRVQPAVDRRGRPRLRGRGRPTSDLAGVAAGGGTRGPVEAPAPPRAATTNESTLVHRLVSPVAGRASSPTSGGSSSPARPTGSPLPPVPPSCGGTGTSRRSCGVHGATSPPPRSPAYDDHLTSILTAIGLHAPVMRSA